MLAPLTLVLTLAPALRAQEAKSVTLHLTARLEQVAAKISEKAGVKLSVDTALKDRIVLVDVDSVPYEELVRRLGLACDAKLEERAGASWLARDPEKEAASEKRGQKDRLESIERTRERLRSIAEAEYTASNVANYIRAGGQAPSRLDATTMLFGSGGANDGTPLGRAGAKIFLSIPPEEIAAMKSGERTVYSTRPTKMQRPIDPKAGDVLKGYTEDLATAAEGVKLAGNEANPQARSAFQTTEEAAKAVKVLAVMSHHLFFGMGVLICEVKALAPTGQVVDTNTFAIWASPLLAGTMDSGLQAFEGESKIVLSEQSQKYLESMSSFVREPDGPETNPAARDETLVRSVDTVEPLSLVAADVIRGLYGGEGKGVVAEIPDQIHLVVMIAGGAKGIDPKRVRKFIFDNVLHPVEETDQSVVLTPIEASEARDQAVDRKALANLVERYPTPGSVTLEDAANYTANRKSRGSGNAIELVTLGSLGIDLVMNQQFGDSGAAASFLDFLGHLPLPQRQTLAAGGTLPYKTQLQDQQRRLREIVYSASGKLEQRSTEAAPHAPDGLEEDWIPYGAQVEPTEALPDGIPADAFIRLTTKNEPLLYTVDPKTGAWGAIDISTLASLIAQKEAAPKAEKSEYVDPPNRFRIGGHRTYLIEFVLGADLFSSMPYEEDVKPTTEKEFTLKTLPPDILKRLQESVKRAREELREMEEEGGGNFTVPDDGG
ncbi:MAG: hypothetical protein KIT11_11480 [Fimbriimonadaceae bacterium]|nr:hypothetical protein [Fimbriimonadaceae bacterium]QYK55346.1 MAG: hypothetical protein KF733_10055 [Fimbriimonadaceae bacterium]